MMWRTDSGAQHHCVSGDVGCRVTDSGATPIDDRRQLAVVREKIRAQKIGVDPHRVPAHSRVRRQLLHSPRAAAASMTSPDSVIAILVIPSSSRSDRLPAGVALKAR
jgi:hypothetical protein